VQIVYSVSSNKMKKYVFIVFALISSYAFAQVKLGPLLQLNYATVNGDIQESTFKTGFGAGFGADFRLDEKLIIEPSLIYSSQNTSFTTDTIGELNLKLDYLCLPIMIKFFANENFNLQIGFQSAFLTSQEIKRNNNKLSPEKKLNNFDYGLSFGCGYYLTDNLHINIRYYVAMADLNKKSIPIKTLYNRVFNLNLNYYFNLSKTKKDL